MKTRQLFSLLMIALAFSAFTSVSKHKQNNSSFCLTVSPDSAIIFDNPYIHPEFPGGKDSLHAFITRNIRYPKEAQDSGIAGRVLISFVVNEDGSLSDIKPLLPKERQLGYGLEEEAMRVVSLMPKWKPGKQDGKPVKVRYIVPVRIKFDH